MHAPATLIRDCRGAPQGQPVRAMTLAEVALHNRADDCYMAIKGKVYNVTPYLEYHPGGPIELMRGAGVLVSLILHPYQHIDPFESYVFSHPDMHTLHYNHCHLSSTLNPNPNPNLNTRSMPRRSTTRSTRG